jgi:hypothetical protein
MTENVHPNITFRITGYRTIAGDSQEKLSNGRGGHWATDHHLFPTGAPQLEDIKAAYPLGSTHAHVPPPPCRFETVFTGTRDMVEERRQLFCRRCYAATVAEDNRKAPAA